MELRPGTRLRSTTCGAEVIVVRAAGEDVELACGGQPMVAAENPVQAGAPAPDASEGTTLGKRYVAGDRDIELLCVQAGEGSLAIDGERLDVKGTKPLPASD